MRLLPQLGFTRPAAVTARVRNSRAVRAVRAFVLMVLILHLGLALALETVLPQWRDPDAGWKFKALQNATAGQPRIVAVGSSRTQMGLAPSAFGPGAPVVFNFGLPGAGPFHHRLAFARLERQGLTPDVLLVEILPAAMGNPASAETFIRLNPGRYSAADLTAMLKDCANTDGLWREWCLQRTNAWYEQRMIIISHLVPSFLPWNFRQDYRWKGADTYGWLARSLDDTSPEKKHERLERSRADYELACRNLNVAEAPAKVLRELVKDCQAKGVPVAFYVMPESPIFRSWYGEGKQEQLRAYFEKLRLELQVPVFDAWDWMAEEDFADGHHLTKAGAEAFSKRLYQELLSPWLQAQRQP